MVNCYWGKGANKSNFALTTNQKMRIMKQILSLFLLLMPPLWSIAQQDPATNQQILEQIGNLSPFSPGILGFDNRYEGVKGSPYLFDTWTSGRIKFTQKDSLSLPLIFNVDLLENLVFVRLKGDLMGTVATAQVEMMEVKATDKMLRQWVVKQEREVEGSKSNKHTFYEVLYAGKSLQLLKKMEKQFRKADYKQAYGTDTRYDEFISETHYWLKQGDAPYQKIKLNQKSFEKGLPGLATDIKKLVTEHRLDLKEEADSARLLEFLEASRR